MRERLKSKPDAVLCTYLSQPSIEADSKRNFYNMVDINLSHVLMLLKQDIIEVQDAQKILDTLLDLRSKGVSVIELDPEKEDFYFNLESYLINKVGLSVGGKMHTARSRNDILSTITRMAVRDAVVPLLEKLNVARKCLLQLADANKGQVLTGYTHMQPAQPISLGFYLLAISQALERDFDRLEAAFSRLNVSALGGGAFAGTSFPIDREYVAGLLGFDAPIENNMDAVVARDYLLEYAADFATLGNTISRFATDLYYWATDEFGYVVVDDSIAICSSIMPQKKNPVTLEHLRAKSSHLEAAYVSIFTVLKGIAFGHCRDGGSESHHLFWDAVNEMNTILELLILTLNKVSFKMDKAKDRADSNFSTVTELADAIVKEEGVSFREAHEIVGHIVGVCVESGLRATDINPKMLDDASEQFISRKLGWSQDHLNSVLDSRNSVNGKTDFGGPNIEECLKMIRRQTDKLQKDCARINEIRQQLQVSQDRLLNEVTNVLKR